MTTTENGEVYGYDARALNLPLMQFKGHSKTTSSLAFSCIILLLLLICIPYILLNILDGVKDICVTAGLDQLIKVWDIANLNDGKPALVATKEPGVVIIYIIYIYREKYLHAIVMLISHGLSVQGVTREHFLFGIC